MIINQLVKIEIKNKGIQKDTTNYIKIRFKQKIQLVFQVFSNLNLKIKN